MVELSAAAVINPDFLPHTRETMVFLLQTHIHEWGVLAATFRDVGTVFLCSCVSIGDVCTAFILKWDFPLYHPLYEQNAAWEVLTLV